MEITVETTNQDHLDFYKAYGFKRNWMRRGLYLLLVDLIISLYLQNTDNLVWPNYFFEIFGIGLLLFPFFFVIPYLVAKAKFKKSFENTESTPSKKIFKPFAVGVEVIEEAGSTFLKYESMKQAGKVGDYVFLMLSNGDYYILPKWCFSSIQEIDHFLRIVNSGIFNEREIESKTKFKFKSVYFVSLLCFIPILGIFIGVLLIFLGVLHYRDKIVVIAGALGVIISISIFSYLNISLTNSTLKSPEFKKALAWSAQTQLDNLIKEIEFYKLQKGAYPGSLQQLNSKGTLNSIYDPIQFENQGRKNTVYNYHKLGDKYLLFSSGIDGIPNTKDDIYPNLNNLDASKLGFIKK
jgi:Type II secretion system (T2SS), protein G